MSYSVNGPLTATEAAVARSEIKAIFDRYGILARELANFSKMAADCFAADGTITLPDLRVVPAPNLFEVLQGEEAKYIRHHVTTSDIKFISKTEAVAATQFIAVTEQGPAPDHWGEWRDELKVQTDGSWKLQHRQIIVDDGPAEGWFIRMYGKLHRKQPAGLPVHSL